ncbi:MAG: hypothetical protein ACE5JU_06710 [Candidatus Binatia bacterium]
MLVLDYTLVVQILSFLLFWFLLDRLVFTPFCRLIEERERRTEGVKAETESLMEEEERLRTHYENGIAKAVDDGNAIKEAIRHDALQARQNLLAQAQEDSARLLQTVQEELQRELQTGRELVAKEAEVIAHQMAEKILGRSMG